MYKEVDFNKMKEKLKKQGCLYQYRPCSISETTIYDLDNIRNGVLYARSPIHMNDPFDSTLAYNEKEIVNEIMDAYLEIENMPEYLKSIINLLLKNRLLKTFPALIDNLKRVKRELDYLIVIKKWPKGSTYVSLYKSHSKEINSHLNRILIEEISPFEIYGILSLLDFLDSNEISEESIQKIKDFNKILDDAEEKLVLAREHEFKEAVMNFQKRLTISCLSSSGWANHLMWSHYTNSYKGICIEYDFTELNEFIGIIDNVTYKQKRPHLKLKDFFPEGAKFEKDDKGNISWKSNANTRVDENKLLRYLFIKQDIWAYEEEWRIVNIENKLDTFRYIPVSKIKSVTFGYNIDPICKCMLFDICKEKNIDLFEIKPSTIDYSIGRVLIDKSSYQWVIEELYKYINFLSKDCETQLNEIAKNVDDVLNSVRNNEFNDITAKTFYEKCLKIVSEFYFYKMAVNNLYKNNENQIEIRSKEEITNTKNMIDNFNSYLLFTIESLLKYIEMMLESHLINEKIYIKFEKYSKDIINIIGKINSLDWCL